MTTSEESEPSTPAAAPPSGQDAPERDVPDDDANPRRWTILGILCLCLILVVAGVSSLNVAIPSIVLALDASQTEQLWILDAYALIFAGLLLPAGALGDRFGRKGALLVGLGIFAGAAVAASYATDPGTVIAMRGAMGIGAALIMPATLSIITVVFPAEERGRAIAVWAGFAGAGGAIGPLASGLLLETFWWGSVFFVNLPIAALAFGAIVVLVPTSSDDEHRPLDPLGALLSVAGLGALVFGIINGPEEGWSHGITIASFVAATAFLVGFVRHELATRFPMLDPRLFRVPRFSLGSLTITANFMAMFGMFYLTTMYLQFVQDQTALGAAVRILPFPITMILVTPRSPRVVARMGPRLTVSIGLVIQASGFALAATLQPGSDYPHLAAALVLMATGMGLLMPPSTEAIVSSLPRSKAGVGSAVNDTTREVGGSIGIALLGSLLSTRYRSGTAELTGTEGMPAGAAEAIRDSIGGAAAAADEAPAAFAARITEVADAAFTSGLLLAYSVAAAIGLATATVVFLLHPRDRDPGAAPADTDGTTGTAGTAAGGAGDGSGPHHAPVAGAARTTASAAVGTPGAELDGGGRPGPRSPGDGDGRGSYRGDTPHTPGDEEVPSTP